jgi:glycosyltransferase involved in cell wall biosynthesis
MQFLNNFPGSHSRLPVAGHLGGEIMGDDFLVSIIINNYNYGSFLTDAIESALNQTYPTLEVIVVDDGSTDDSREIIAGYSNRIIPVLKENGGQASAFNTGFLASRGEIVFFLDADDTLLPTAVDSAVDFFREGEARQINVVKVHWSLWNVDEHGERTGSIYPDKALGEGELRELVVRKGPGNHVSPPTSGNAWHRHFLDRVLPIPEMDFRICADMYLFELAPLYGAIKRVVTPQACYRRHGRNAYAARAFDERVNLELWNYDRCCEALSKHCLGLGIDIDREAWKQHSWLYQIQWSLREIVELVPPDHQFILVDQGEWGASGTIAGRHVIPLLGQYWGVPANDAIAIEELERLRSAGAGLVVFAWPAFWWLDYYPEFHRHLRASYRCVLENDRLVAFDLQSA